MLRLVYVPLRGKIKRSTRFTTFEGRAEYHAARSLL